MPAMHWHPMLVHFPITLVIIWPFIDVVGLILNLRSLNILAIVLLGLAVVSSLAAATTGEVDEHAAIDLGYSHELLQPHTFLADLFPWVMFAVLVIRILGSVWWGKQGGAWLGIILGFCCCPLVAYIGYTGGQLVFEKGIGVNKDAPKPTKPSDKSHH